MGYVSGAGHIDTNSEAFEIVAASLAPLPTTIYSGGGQYVCITGCHIDRGTLVEEERMRDSLVEFSSATGPVGIEKGWQKVGGHRHAYTDSQALARTRRHTGLGSGARVKTCRTAKAS